VVRLFYSARLAAWLIAMLCAFLLVSYLIPQSDIMPAEQFADWSASQPALSSLAIAVGLDHIFTTPFFYGVVILLVVNLLACTLRRVLRHPWRDRKIRVPRKRPASAVGVRLSASPADLERMLTDGESLIRLESDEGLVVIGGVVSALTSFKGEMVLTEGQSVSDGIEAYTAVSQLPRFGAGFGDFAIGLDHMEFTYADDTIVEAVAHMTVAKGQDVDDRETRVNYPLRVDGKSFLLFDGGHAVQLSILSPGREILMDSYVNLGEKTQEGFADSVEIDDFVIEVRTTADVAALDAGLHVPALVLKDPAAWIIVSRDGVVVGDAILRPGEELEVEDHVVLVGDIRLWNRFLVRADKGLPILYIAFALALLGAAMRFLDPDRYVVVEVTADAGGSQVAAWGRDRYTRSRTVEVDRILERLGIEDLVEEK